MRCLKGMSNSGALIKFYILLLYHYMNPGFNKINKQGDTFLDSFLIDLFSYMSPLVPSHFLALFFHILSHVNMNKLKVNISSRIYDSPLELFVTSIKDIKYLAI